MFAQKLKETREAKGVSVETLADAVGLTRAAIYNYEKGIKMPNVATASEIAKVLGVSLDELTK